MSVVIKCDKCDAVIYPPLKQKVEILEKEAAHPGQTHICGRCQQLASLPVLNTVETVEDPDKYADWCP